MGYGVNILELADRLVADATSAQKTASAEDAAPTAQHPVARMLKEAAATLRSMPDAPAVGLEDVAKLAGLMQPGTGAQSPSSGSAMGSKTMAPTLPSLKTNNLGVTAGTGGAAPAPKIAQELRKLANVLRAEDENETAQTSAKTAHVLNAATGLHLLLDGVSL